MAVALSLFAGLAATATGATATHTGAAKAQSGISLKRTKSEATWARWHYQLSFVPLRNARSVKVLWGAPSALRISGPGVKKSEAGKFVRTLKSVRAHRRVTVGFWAWSNAARKLCFRFRVANSRVRRACNPSPPPAGSGPGLLTHFGAYCQVDPGDGSADCLKSNGVVKLRIFLDDECGGCYDYGNGVPVTVTLFPQGFSFGGDNPAGFTGKIVPEPGGGCPVPSKSDKQWRWVKVQSQKVPVWQYNHLCVGSIPNWLFTITVPAGTDQVCIQAVVQTVWAAPVEPANTWCFAKQA